MSRSRKPQRKTSATAQATGASQRTNTAKADTETHHRADDDVALDTPVADEDMLPSPTEDDTQDAIGDDIVPYEAVEDEELTQAELAQEDPHDDLEDDLTDEDTLDEVVQRPTRTTTTNSKGSVSVPGKRMGKGRAATRASQRATKRATARAAAASGPTAKDRSPEAKKAAARQESKADRRAALRAQQEAAQRKARTRRILGIVAGLLAFALLVGGLWWLINFLENKDARVRPPHAVGLKGIRIADGTPLKEGAPTVVLYHDYQCPACSTIEETYGPILLEMAKNGEIRYEAHTLTFLDNSLGTQHSKRAASAAACADEVGKFPEVMAAIYKLQPKKEGNGWSEDQFLKDIPKQAGMDDAAKARYTSCYESQKYMDFVKAVDKRASAELVNAGKQVGTPQILVNGKPLQAERIKEGDPKTIRDAIEASK